MRRQSTAMLRDDRRPSPEQRRPAAPAQQILVVGSEDWAIRQAEAELTDAGRAVHRCHESAEAPFPCNALVASVGCPLDRFEVNVVLDVRSRARSDPSLGEMGAICGLRAGLPLVVAGLSGAMKLAPWATQVPLEGTMVDSCDDAVRRAHPAEAGDDAVRPAHPAGKGDPVHQVHPGKGDPVHQAQPAGGGARSQNGGHPARWRRAVAGGI